MTSLSFFNPALKVVFEAPLKIGLLRKEHGTGDKTKYRETDDHWERTIMGVGMKGLDNHQD